LIDREGVLFSFLMTATICDIRCCRCRLCCFYFILFRTQHTVTFHTHAVCMEYISSDPAWSVYSHVYYLGIYIYM